MSQKDKFEVVRKKVIEKIGRIPKGMKDDEFAGYCNNLIEKKKLIENYLNKNFDGIKKLLMRLPKSKKKFSAFTSESKEYVNLQTLDVLPDDVNECPNDMIPVLEREEKSLKPYQLTRSNTISIKLVITEIASKSKKKLFRKMLSPIMFGFNRQQEFGWFHSSIIVGPWYLEWTNSSLCIPRKCYSKAALIAADIKRVYKGNVDNIINKISDVIIQWNCTKKYDQVTANCQHFVDDILNALGINLNYGGAFGDFLTNLRKNGVCKIEWRPNKKALEKFKFLNKVHKFKTHKQLDALFVKIQEQEPLWLELPCLKGDLKMVKAFDRAFWLRNFSQQKRGIKDEKYLPLKKGSSILCPFDSPLTNSYLKEWF